MRPVRIGSSSTNGEESSCSLDEAMEVMDDPDRAKSCLRGGSPVACLTARHWIVALVFCSRVGQTVLRMAMGALIIPFCEEIRCEAWEKGWLLSAHAAGYCSTQILGGWMADRLGGKRVMSWALGLSSLAVLATPAAASAFGPRGVIACEVVMGAAMGPTFPSSMQLLARWLPVEDRAMASTALDSGITLGSLIVVPLSGVLVLYNGWRVAYTVYGLGMLAFALVFAWLAADSPTDCGYCSAEERLFLEVVVPQVNKQGKSKVPTEKSSIAYCLSYARLWAIYGSHFIFNYAVYFVNCWSATFYFETFGLRPEQAGLYLSMPHLINSVVKVMVNPALERQMMARGFDTLRRRRIFSVLGFVGLSAFLGLAPYLATLTRTTMSFSVAFGFLALHPSGFKANYMDVTTSRGGLVSGIGNTIGSLGSTAGPLVVAHLRDVTGGWTAAFQSVSLLSVAAAVLFSTMSSTVPIEADEVPAKDVGDVQSV
ncbi:unnamed protein product [Prorocentrum cordatum]|uniref:Major facilitator superfamily (MFS) profile domain-containing protein n=1 Tax=Prorocentrum cordatum TaxID=2364126 RepID=A0ABN9SYI6_9DINO|nr:unnamed protein product [Polarella glacialis]